MMEEQKIYIPESSCLYRVISYHVDEDSVVSKSQKLATYKCWRRTKGSDEVKNLDEIKDKDLLSPSDGKIVSIIAKCNQELSSNNAILAILSECEHSIQARGICAICGCDLPTIYDHNQPEDSNTKIQITYDSFGVTVSPNLAAKFDEETVSRLREQRKLALIIDLDQTLIHTRIGRLAKDDGESLNMDDIIEFTHSNEDFLYYVKLRPGVKTFLDEMSKIYELHMYTMGTREYALKVVSVLDPQNSIFNHRVLTREESGSIRFKTVSRIFPYDQSMSVIVDDRFDVWNWAPNLYKVSPYYFFKGAPDMNTSIHELGETPKVIKREDFSEKEPQVSEENVQKFVYDVKKEIDILRSIDSDNDLARVSEVLTQVHEKYYDLNKLWEESNKKRPENEKNSEEIELPNTYSIMAEMKSSVLKGINIAFSGIVPPNEDITKSNFWISAVVFGAQCFKDLVPGITHLVALPGKRSRLEKARKMDTVQIVHPNWLVDTIHRWERQDEKLYTHKDPSDECNRGFSEQDLALQGEESNEKNLDIQDLDDKYIMEQEDDVLEINIPKEEWDRMNNEVDEIFEESTDDAPDKSDGSYNTPKEEWDGINNEVDEIFEESIDDDHDKSDGSYASVRITDEQELADSDKDFDYVRDRVTKYIKLHNDTSECNNESGRLSAHFKSDEDDSENV